MAALGPLDKDSSSIPVAAPARFTVSHQDVELDLDFTAAAIHGRTVITVEPLVRDLREVQFCCRGMVINSVKVDKKYVANYTYKDPFDSFNIRDNFTVHQHHWMQDRFDADLLKAPDLHNLTIPLVGKPRSTDPGRIRLFVDTSNLPASHDSDKFRPVTITIDYHMRNLREGVHWIGVDRRDHRYPHAYTYSNSLAHTLASYLFPCVDDNMTKSTWRLAITGPRTLADLVTPLNSGDARPADLSMKPSAVTDLPAPFTDEESALELTVVCSGYMEESDAPVDLKESCRKWVFYCSTPVLPRHIGFAIGPFEQVDLSQFRDSEQDDKMGQSVVAIHGFCLPGRANEMRNICMPLASALDKLSTSFVFYPFESEFSSYTLCFVDDLPMNVVDTATLSICSSRLLVPDVVIDPVYESTRELVHAVASQWLGVKLTARYQEDSWLIVGGSYFMADWFMMTLWGRNEHRFRLKKASEKVHEVDVRKPALYYMGSILEVDSDEYDFVKLKAPLVLFILHNRILKANGRIGVNRALSRVLLDDQVGKIDYSIIDTERFMRACEKVAHSKVDAFFNQWIYGAGCPTFVISQRFNKKKLVVEMMIQQRQSEEQADLSTALTPETFMREAKEEEEDIRRGPNPPIFTGPMTIRIHEADGTPYEHIVDIKELSTKVEIQYNTKYKRLKRNRRAKERAAAAAGVDISGDPQDDSLLYCLGDVLQSEEEIREWQLSDWSKEDEDKMNNEHFEWIRLDKDFEWIAKVTFNQPHYMFVSQLQQDNDVVAQSESLQYLIRQQPHPLISAILIRTLMDQRYFYGVRVLAASALAKCATPELNWIGLTHLEKAFQELFYLDKSNMTRSNDFSDMRQYMVQCAMVDSIANVRDHDGKAPDRVKRFFLDALKFNDNSNNEKSDSFYVAKLMAGLANSLLVTGTRSKPKTFSVEELESMNEIEQQRMINEERTRIEQEAKDLDTQNAALEEIQRFRRIDQWIPSYQNIYTVTALDTVKELMLNGALDKILGNFLFYTRFEHSSPVRLKAFSSLVDLGTFSDPAIACYYITSFYEEISPYFRDRLWKIIARGFAKLAQDEQEQPTPKIEEPIVDGLVVETGEKTGEDRRAHQIRTQTIQGVVSVMKERIGENQDLKDVILEALKAPRIGLDRFLDLLTLCRMLYDPTDNMIVTLKLPPYYKATKVGNGKVTFASTGKFRIKPFTKWEDRCPKNMIPPPASPMPIQVKRPHSDVDDPNTISALETNGAPETKRLKIAFFQSNDVVPSPSPPIVDLLPSVAAHAVPSVVFKPRATPKQTAPSKIANPSSFKPSPAPPTPSSKLARPSVPKVVLKSATGPIRNASNTILTPSSKSSLKARPLPPNTKSKIVMLKLARRHLAKFPFNPASLTPSAATNREAKPKSRSSAFSPRKSKSKTHTLSKSQTQTQKKSCKRSPSPDLLHKDPLSPLSSPDIPLASLSTAASHASDPLSPTTCATASTTKFAKSAKSAPAPPGLKLKLTFGANKR